MAAKKPTFPNQPTDVLLARAHMALGMSQGQLGGALGVSRRTVSRWYKRGALLGMSQLHALARLVHARDPQLAAEIAWTASETLESLGIVAPPPPPSPPPAAPPPPPPLPTNLVVDAVVCAAAESLGMAPTAVRAALFAAFKRTRELRLRLEDVEAALAPAPSGRRATPRE
jgi:hypothetical protein